MFWANGVTMEPVVDLNWASIISESVDETVGATIQQQAVPFIVNGQDWEDR
jgi:hypothetical protein